MATFIDGVVDWIDRVQRRYPPLAFPFAVSKRYGEDNGGWAGALISYYGFFSLFPRFLSSSQLFREWVNTKKDCFLKRSLRT